MGILAHTAVLSHDRNVQERTVWIASDNRATVAWATKGLAMSLTARSHLLRINALTATLPATTIFLGPSMPWPTTPVDGGT